MVKRMVNNKVTSIADAKNLVKDNVPLLTSKQRLKKFMRQKDRNESFKNFFNNFDDTKVNNQI